MESLRYKDGNLLISETGRKRCMCIPCDGVFASKILESCRKAVRNPIKADDEDIANNRDARILQLMREDYVCAGEFPGGILFVGYPGLDISGKHVIIFTYVPNSLPAKNGPTQVNVLMSL